MAERDEDCVDQRKLRATLELLWSWAVFHNVYENESVIAWQLSDIVRQGGLAERGLEEGDRIFQVCGLPVSSFVSRHDGACCAGANRIWLTLSVERPGEGARSIDIALVDSLTSALDESRDSAGALLRFWPGPRALEEMNPRVEISSHPCGPIVESVVRRMPDQDDPFLRPDTFLEFDAQGSEVRRWRGPIDQLEFGLRGDRLLISDASEDVLSVAPDGTFAVEHEVSLPSPAGDWACPDRFRGADVVCMVLTDLETGAQRMLIVPFPCT